MNLDYEAAKEQWKRNPGDIKAMVDAAVPKPCKHGNRDPHLAVKDDEARIHYTNVYNCDGTPEADNGVHWGNTSGKPEADDGSL